MVPSPSGGGLGWGWVCSRSSPLQLDDLAACRLEQDVVPDDLMVVVLRAGIVGARDGRGALFPEGMHDIHTDIRAEENVQEGENEEENDEEVDE